MAFPDAIVMGFGKMPADCASVLLQNEVAIRGILETEKAGFSGLAGFAERAGIPFAAPARDEITHRLSLVDKPTVVFSINNNYIFPRDVCGRENLRIVNFHNSLLPHYRGHGRVIPSWVVFAGEARHGVTWHLVSADVDGGNILCQGGFEVSEDDTALQVMMRAVSLGIRLFARHWQEFMDPEYKGRPQGEARGRIFGKNDVPNRGEMDLSWDFKTAGRFLRSMDYGVFRLLPLPRIRLDGKWYVVRKYRIESRGNRFSKGGVQVVERPEGKAGDAAILYPEGIIRLSIAEEKTR
ncbi:MAG: hypothetical protein JRJ26_13225 [Deltaproteobacteria bacterium]|nr:hypothetical protein [Deltaproteobacteria bacterium]